MDMDVNLVGGCAEAGNLMEVSVEYSQHEGCVLNSENLSSMGGGRDDGVGNVIEIGVDGSDSEHEGCEVLSAQILSSMGGGCDEVGNLIEIGLDGSEQEGCQDANTQSLENITLTQTIENTSPLPTRNGKANSPVQNCSPNETIQTVETNVLTNEFCMITTIDPPKIGMVF